MKLLLTSSGIVDDTIAAELQGLIGKVPADVKVGFVPTAANGEVGDKHWLIADYVRLWKCGYEWIDIVDPSAADLDWRDRLKDVDVVFIAGGNTFHLLKQAQQTGFMDWLTEHANDKVLVGSSAGSILMTPTISVSGIADANHTGMEKLDALGFVDFEFIPHIGAMISLKQATAYAKKAKYNVYAVDDATAITVVDGKVQVVGRGEHKLYKKPAAK
ncbi:MAG: Type 1 glutamine amidotransferase-like domain-containing protein [Candidatus Saccharibacteria bacterium]